MAGKMVGKMANLFTTKVLQVTHLFPEGLANAGIFLRDIQSQDLAICWQLQGNGQWTVASENTCNNTPETNNKIIEAILE